MKKKVLASLCAAAVILAGVNAGAAYAKKDKDSGGTDCTGEGVICQELATDCARGFFGMRPWYQGLTTKDNDGRCVVGTPATDADGNTMLAPFVWTIILNVLVDLFTMVGIASVGYLILGGYWYMRSGGDPTLVARGKKTIQTAVIGTGIALLATLATNFIVTILTNS